MKILYGVQATGQGHISRARAMAKAFKYMDVEVDWLFSGRDRKNLFGMDFFRRFEHRRGLTYQTQAGKVDHLRTLIHNNLPRFWLDVKALETKLEDYDLVVTDFEPVTAWAAKLKGAPAIGIGHQYAFGPGTPSTGENWLSDKIMNWFAPVSQPIGLHWRPYGDNILPPILDLPALKDHRDHYILVYLPSESQSEVITWLQQFPLQQFKLYHKSFDLESRGNVDCFRTNTEGFKYHLRGARGVICNSGFELISECLQWRKSVLTKPLLGQMEQLSNATALEQLSFANVIRSLSHDALGSWLQSRNTTPQIQFPDVAAELAKWLVGERCETLVDLGRDLWNQVEALSAENTAFTPRTPSSAATEAFALPLGYSGSAPLSPREHSQSWRSSAP
ncbi:MAG: MJ1255/VC2487 family glycosyltransferase [Halioglobus sp.]